MCMIDYPGAKQLPLGAERNAIEFQLKLLKSAYCCAPCMLNFSSRFLFLFYEKLKSFRTSATLPKQNFVSVAQILMQDDLLSVMWCCGSSWCLVFILIQAETELDRFFFLLYSSSNISMV